LFKLLVYIFLPLEMIKYGRGYDSTTPSL